MRNVSLKLFLILTIGLDVVSKDIFFSSESAYSARINQLSTFNRRYYAEHIQMMSLR